MNVDLAEEDGRVWAPGPVRLGQLDWRPLNPALGAPMESSRPFDLDISPSSVSCW